jgi:hypothetical protein
MRAFLKISIFIVIVIATIAVIVFKKWDGFIYGLIFLCPIMHLFGHKHHSGHNH